MAQINSDIFDNEGNIKETLRKDKDDDDDDDDNEDYFGHRGISTHSITRYILEPSLRDPTSYASGTGDDPRTSRDIRVSAWSIWSGLVVVFFVSVWLKLTRRRMSLSIQG